MFLFVNLFQHTLIGMSLNLHISHQKKSNLNVLYIESKFTFEKKKKNENVEKRCPGHTLKIFYKSFSMLFLFKT